MADRSEDECPRCQRRLAHTPQGWHCPYCGYDFSISPEALDSGEYFAGAECGVFGLIIGLELGAALGLAAGGGEAMGWTLVGAAAGGGLLGAVFSGWLANRVAAEMRRGLRRLLLSACAAGIVVLLLAAAGLTNIDTLLLMQLGTTLAVYLTSTYATRLLERGGNAAAGRK